MTVNLFSDKIKPTIVFKVIVEVLDEGFDKIIVEHRGSTQEFMEVSQLLDYLTRKIRGGRKQ